MLKFLYWKVRDWLERIVYGPAEWPKEVRDAVENKRQGYHLMTDQEYVDLAKSSRMWCRLHIPGASSASSENLPATNYDLSNQGSCEV